MTPTDEVAAALAAAIHASDTPTTTLSHVVERCDYSRARVRSVLSALVGRENPYQSGVLNDTTHYWVEHAGGLLREPPTRLTLREQPLDEVGEAFSAEDIVIEEPDVGLEGRLSEAAQRRELREQVLAEREVDLDTEDELPFDSEEEVA